MLYGFPKQLAEYQYYKTSDSGLLSLTVDVHGFERFGPEKEQKKHCLASIRNTHMGNTTMRRFTNYFDSAIGIFKIMADLHILKPDLRYSDLKISTVDSIIFAESFSANCSKSTQHTVMQFCDK